MTDLTFAPSPAIERTPIRALSTISSGLIGGCVLGVIARAWMRVISDDPGFSWSGTIFIVAGFTIFGFGQSVVAVARRRLRRRWVVTLVRVFGAITMAPIFGAAGGVMLPTVVGCGLAIARTDWKPITRRLWLLIATGPLVLVGSQIVGPFGWSLHSLAGITLMVLLYATMSWVTRPTLVAQLDGWKPSRRVRLASLLLLVVPVAGLLAMMIGVG